MLCFSLMLTTVGCDTSTDQSQTQTNSQNWPVTLRTPLDECSDCPEECCCCGIEIVGLNGFTIQLCGLCEGDYLCGTYSPSSPCSSISGLGKDISLTPPGPFGRPREVFCVEPGASIRIFNPSSTVTASFKFTCQYDVTPNTFITVTLQPHEEKFFFNNGSCMTEGCP